MRRSQAELAREEIIAFFDGTSRKALTLTNLVGILDDHGDEWRLARTMTLNKFIHFLLDRTQLTMHKFPFPSQSTTLYYWGSPMVYEIAMQLRPTGYLSHLTAMQYHNLLEANTQRTIYINVEQSPKPMHPGELDQSRIDAAFRRPPRLTRNRAQVEDYTYCLLSGKNTSMLEVRNEKAPGIADPIKVTSLERTLVDSVVRPAYSGGARYILEAYRRAADKVDIQRLTRVLDQLQHVYPYHQAIGFFMDLSQGYSKEQLDVIRKYPKRFDFYADYEIIEPKYSGEWRIYYPSYLESHPN